MINGEILSHRRISVEVSSAEVRELENKLRLATAPEVHRIMDLGFNKTASEGIIILDCLDNCGKAKKYLHNNAAASIFTATALATILQSDDPSLISEVTYEVSDRKKPGKEGYFDVLNIKMEGQKKDANIPVPVINQSVLGYLAKKIEIVAFKPNYTHDRKFSNLPFEVASNAEIVATSLLNLYKTVDLRCVCHTILANYTEGDIYSLIKMAREVNRSSISRMDFVKVLGDWEKFKHNR